MSDRWQSTMIAHGALVFLVGMVAGFPFAFVILQKVALWPLPAVLEDALAAAARTEARCA